ncbi:hypothetical protein MUP77_11415, partial [Candidatus Bathyarchaeota archaeon]|nr:hypothetical protein [Candidatus Bathyarchaeota archaeon]
MTILARADICALCNPVDNSFFQINRSVVEDVGRLKDAGEKIQVLFGYLEDTAEWRVSTDDLKNDCKHLGTDGYCTLWWWKEEQQTRRQKQDTQGLWRDNVREHPLICVACPRFDPNSDAKQ